MGDPNVPPLRKGAEHTYTKEELLDVYREAVREASNHTVVFIPNTEDELNTQDVKELLNEQYPGYGDLFSEGQLSYLADATASDFPRSGSTMAQEYNGELIVPVSEPSIHVLTKDDIVEGFIQKTPEEIGGVAGNDEDWVRILGHHEGQHSNQNAHTISQELLALEGKVPITEIIDRVNHWHFSIEVDADIFVGEKLKEENKLDVAHAWKDIRTLNTFDKLDHQHASQVALNETLKSIVSENIYQIPSEAKAFMDVEGYDSISLASKTLIDRVGNYLLRENSPGIEKDVIFGSDDYKSLSNNEFYLLL